MKATLRAIDAVIPYARNARVIPQGAIDKVAASIKEFGWRQPIVIDEEGVIIAGHARHLAAQKLGLDKVPVHVADGLTPAQAKAYRLMDNRSHDEASWNDELLGLELEELQGLNIDLSLTGFEGVELEELFGKLAGSAGLTDDDAVPEPPANPVTQIGDVWILGRHRLVCGNSTDPSTVDLLTQGKRAQLCLTDPPYCVDYENIVRTPSAKTVADRGQAYEDPTDAFALLSGFIPLIPSDILVMSFPIAKHFHHLARATADWDMLYDCIWVKNQFAFNMNRRYQVQHEPIMIFRRRSAKGKGVFNIPNNQSSVFQYDKPSANVDHPTPKPVELWEKLVQYHSNAGGVIYEPFSGSGTTFIACEKTGRECRGIELQPSYCDVIVKRWEEFTGEDAIHEKTGKKFKASKAA